ncbi:MAG: hypothetical protein JWQ30_808 [Sediminibacterium sp.]|nr:hypothetical protein [Sediminibacterium sp.]
MKKVIAFVAVVVCFSVTTAMAQGGGGGQQTPEQLAARIAQQKERLAPVGLTPAQTDSVIAIYGDRSMMAGMTRDTPAEERAAKMKEVGEAREKRMAKAGLSAEAVKKVVDIMSQGRGGGGRPGGGGK